MKRVFQYFALFLFSFFTLMFSSIMLKAQGNLVINPRRVVFEGSKRVIALNLANTGSDSAKYNISFLQYRMKEDGGFEIINEPDSLQRFADRYLRIFPRSVQLGPNESQVVKVQLTKANSLSVGEYRSHLYFRAVPEEKPLGEAVKDTSKSISVKLVPIFGISIPVIIRSGESNTRVNISDPAFQMTEDGQPLLKIQLNRSGNMSIYGDLTVTHVSPQGKTTQVALAKGVSVYTPNLKRRIVLNLDKNKGINYREGKISVEYSSEQDAKPEMFAKSYLKLD